MKAEACSSGLQSSDPRGRSLAGPPSTPGVRVAMHGRESWLGEAMSAARPGEGTRGGEIGVSPPELGSEDGALPIACRVPAPRPPFEALKATKCFNRQNPRRQALWSPRRTDGGTEASAGCVATPRLGSEAGGRGCRRVEDPRFAVWQQRTHTAKSRTALRMQGLLRISQVRQLGNSCHSHHDRHQHPARFTVYSLPHDT